VAALIAAIILAAGESARLGRPKQLLPFRGRSLLRHVIDCATEGGCDPVLVVLGARAEEMRAELEGSAAQRVLNAAWRQGIGSSVRTGVAAVRQRWPAASAVLLLTCDQPRITPQLVRRICDRFDRADARIVACEYAGTIGVPALFERSLFPELLALPGTTGAKPVLEAHPTEVVRLAWPDGAEDIDRPEDLRLLS
jgi:molybdenum cofactor cytidylyltransferase